MFINTNSIITATETNQNFSKASRMAEEQGKVIIFKKNRPKYMLIDIEKSPVIEMTDNEKLEFVAKRILSKYKKAFTELAK